MIWFINTYYNFLVSHHMFLSSIRDITMFMFILIHCKIYIQTQEYNKESHQQKQLQTTLTQTIKPHRSLKCRTSQTTNHQIKTQKENTTQKSQHITHTKNHKKGQFTQLPPPKHPNTNPGLKSRKRHFLFVLSDCAESYTSVRVGIL